MARPRLVHYAGAAGRISLERVTALGARFVVQPKLDGALAEVHLDGRGRVERIFQRNGDQFGAELVGHLVGAQVGRPGSVLVGELEAHSERSTRAAATRGWRALHLFDCIRDGAAYLARAPYHERRDALWRMHSEVVNYGPELPWAREDGGRARETSSGRFCEAIPTDWRLMPIVEQRTASQAEAAWADWVDAPGGEGLVVVALDAPMGKGKRKCKATETLDCRVVRTGEISLDVEYGGHVFLISARAATDRDIKPGNIVEVVCDGWYENSAQPLPKNPRLVRRRPDL